MTFPLEQRVDIGKNVRFWIEQLQVEINEDSDEQQNYFWKEFHVELQRQNLIPLEHYTTELSDQQGEEYSKRLCPFNQYKDIAYRAVPYDYLAFIVDSNKWLELYLKWRMKKGMTQ